MTDLKRSRKIAGPSKKVGYPGYDTDEMRAGRVEWMISEPLSVAFPTQHQAFHDRTENDGDVALLDKPDLDEEQTIL